MQVGIDQIGFYTPNKYVDMLDLAHARGVEPNKYLIGIGQSKMSVADQSQDAVSMGINATLSYINKVDLEQVGLLIMGTESGVDQSKSASLFVKSALKLPPEVRTFEIKEACFGMTAGIMVARDYVRLHPEHSAIVIGSDIARYGLKTGGEVTQGAGSVSVLIKANPRILALTSGHSAYSADINDFWRPNNSAVALVDGKYSTEVYLDFFQRTFQAYKSKQKMTTADFTAILYHLPFVKMGLKANQLAVAEQDAKTKKRLEENFTASTLYSKQVGNIYTASLYLGLLSLLEDGKLSAADTIGLFSYGSGAMGEFYAGKVMANYEQALNKVADEKMIARRQQLTIADYEQIFKQALQFPADNIELSSDEAPGYWYFAGTKNHVRQYQRK
ncbi:MULTISPECIES: hydroxymethylglutaryl-CoA synthase [unclassified Lactobacillus]|uniref:hydroxymethylglutaryl-CoA synthase n=1 Tax=unclassified Lactobacillus TaxID=2620435 RepID=UPI000EFCA273|nr:MULTISPECIES: hydroxymethylglutaryl-CoA synthase [unclassified Lactobacillus]RMC40723.1 hydroxymethylglutaryl-CoA synthase [Lactobacillus sp. ESL0237]RMC44481.1 hydroxymethylglutaryl-CoA synthase [Lactobacillus sp. ESL0234]RMC45787.1 hydroxymethylglutaryl-CoA synthase [Lactobacillus sp. ESL0236]RMC46108.1 hydroxymethylglutaryl-CoA synthase [Lactobacillus sp. ESL0230]RMC51177.1 hydroxymethylglutaryl-CoA synthase [Lactobacillus sp. ESL0225]